MSGTEGYAEEAEALVEQYERLRFAELHKRVLHLVPAAPSRVLDIGAGTGRDAAAFAAMGHAVVAVEPTAELRARAAVLHPSPRIEWLDDGLPAVDEPFEPHADETHPRPLQTQPVEQRPGRGVDVARDVGGVAQGAGAGDRREVGEAHLERHRAPE